MSSLPVRSVGLTSIVERLAGELGVAYAAVNLLSEDDAFVLAQAGLDERARISLELCDPDMLADDHREAVNREMPTALSRDRTLDAHVILNRGQLVLLPDLAEDFRFYSRTLGDNSTSGAWAYSSGNEAARMPFYAGQAVLSPDGLPIGTVCVMDATPHSRLPREDMDRIAAAALEVGRELERLRNGELKRSLEGLDHSLSLFASQAAELERTRAQESRSESAAEASPGIETVLLQPDLNEPPLSAGQEKSTAPSLAARRGAPVPARLGLGPTISSQIGNPVPQRHSQHRVLELALQTITRSLATELAYIAIVGSDPLSCTPVVTHFRTEAETSRLRLDAPLHLSALTASKKGLLLGNEPVRVGGLLGIGRKEWKSALVVPCGLKEGGRSWRGTEGWTLAIATKDERKVFGPETTLYLKRFASLLGPLLLGGPRSPSSPAFSLPPNMPLPPLPTRTSSGAHRRTSQAPSVASEETEVSPPRPSKSPHRPRRTALLGAEAILAATACSSPGLASTVSSPRGSLASRDHHLSPRSPSPVARRSPSPVPSPTSSLNRADTRGGSLSPVFGRRNLPALSPPPCSPPPPTPPPTCPLPLPPPGASSRATSPMPSPVTARANASPIAEEVEVLLDTPQLEREMGTSTSLSKSKGQSVSPDSSFMEMPPFAATATMA